MNALWIAAAAVAGYVLGSVSFAVIIARRHGVDILKVGSGNPGATNVKRVLGRGPGNVVFVLDFLKGFVAAGWPVLAAALQLLSAGVPVDGMGLAGLAGAIAGHSCSMFLKFRGGKGVATAIGGLAALMPLVIGAGVVVWLVVFYVTRYVSLASILLGVALAPLAYAMHRPAAQVVFCVLLGLVILVRHRSNIERLVKGTEHRFGANGADTKEPEKSGN
ncbi:MAG: glycerol-3-phosphate 1-O-acyltransferase PlsY [Opitutales bacterium]|jgi:glycerol-3-phosphate acyltransferase PlsY